MNYFCKHKFFELELTVLFFGITTDLVGKTSLSYFLKRGNKINDLKNQLFEDFPQLKSLNSYAIAINESYATNNSSVKEGDIIAIIPPVSGG